MWTYGLVREGERGLLYRNGRFVQELEPGRYRLRRAFGTREEVRTVDLRRRQLLLNGQEMLTADPLPARFNLVGEYRVTDAPRAVHTVDCFESALYTALQVLLREEVQALPLETLLAERAALAARLLERGRVAAADLGLELLTVGLRDVILPADVRRLLTGEVEALRAGRAALAAAREEVAAARARANTAQLLAANPVLLRLRELEALVEMANGQGSTVIVAAPPEALTAVRTAGGLDAGR
jgi:regulator of protease activity HflC (stomatin/prohibitin superfamily)